MNDLQTIIDNQEIIKNSIEQVKDQNMINSILILVAFYICHIFFPVRNKTNNKK